MSFIVAIDGPAGSGKGTIAKRIAEKYNLIDIDTGAMYRCIALKALQEGVKLEEEEKLIQISETVKIDLTEDGQVFLDGVDVSTDIRSKEVTAMVYPMSSIKEIRLNMVKLQRKMAEGKRIIVEGRDITTYVFPNADVKIYLDASVEERAKRRFKEMQEKGIETTFEEVIENIKQRDEYDKNKEMGALMIADDATVVDTTDYDIDEVADIVSKIIDNCKKQKGIER